MSAETRNWPLPAMAPTTPRPEGELVFCWVKREVRVNCRLHSREDLHDAIAFMEAMMPSLPSQMERLRQGLDGDGI